MTISNMRFRFLVALVAIPLQSSFAQTFQDFLGRVAAAPDSARTVLVDSFMNAVGSLPLIESDTVAHFIYRGSVSSVTVPGDANEWNTSAFPMVRLSTTDLWYHTRSFESSARLDYKFVLNGSTWILDPRNPHTVSGGFGPNSELRMPAYIPAPEIQFYPGIPHGQLWDTTFFSVNLGNSRTVRIYTPPGYQTSTDSFPVVLFHDGLEYVTLAQANNCIDYLVSQNRILPLIAVFVPPVNRTAEYAGNQMNQFSAFIVDELMSYVAARFRTRRDPAGRAVLGASNGGNISLWLGLNYPSVFGNVAAQSSNIIGAISSGFQNSPRLDLKLYLDLGTYDIAALIPLVRNFIPILQSRGYVYRYDEFYEGHSWGNWRAHVDNALEMFFPATPSAVGDAENQLSGFRLYQNYPNPFNPSTTINFSVLATSCVSIQVYDVLGQTVATLYGKIAEGGSSYSVLFDGRNFQGSQLSSGVYFYRLIASPGTSEMKQMLLMR